MDKKANPFHSDEDGEEGLREAERRESESSTERSQYFLEDAMAKSTPHLKTYAFYYTKRHTNLMVCDELKNVIYFSRVSELSSPDLALHQGVDKHAPVVAVAHFRLSRDLKLGIGNPEEGDKDMVWEKMENISKGLGHSKYRVEMTINDGRRSFLWQRTRDRADGVQGAGKWINWNYRLVEESTGEVVAVYLENFLKSWKKKGKLQLKADLGKQWELMVLLGSLGLCEKASRRARYRSAAVGGPAAGAAAGGGGE